MKPATYLLHFARPLAHAQHYIGATENLPGRLMAHYKGNGARLPQVMYQRGIGMSLARVWYGTHSEIYALERFFKRRYKSARKLCPLCHK